MRVIGGLARALLLCLVLAVFLGLGGFLRFSSELSTLNAHGPPPQADAIVVLTGGKARIETALDLLERGRGNRLLISGVHPRTSAAAIRKAVGGDSRLFDCCIDIDRAALDTTGNAEEAGKWMRRHGFASLIVVTSDYHMPRSLMEIRRYLADIRLIPYPVHQADAGGRGWIDDPEALRLVASEYLKYLAASLRLRLHGGEPGPAFASATAM